MIELEVELLAGLMRDFPCTFDPANTPETKNIYLCPFHSVQNYAQWNNAGSTSLAGCNQKVTVKAEKLEILLVQVFKVLFRNHPKLLKLATAYLQKGCTSEKCSFHLDG